MLAAGETLARVCEDPKQEKVLSSLTADEGYFAVEEVGCLQAERVRVVIGDPHAGKRKPEKQDGVVRAALSKAKRVVKSASSKALLRKRREHLKRSFCHVLDHGKLRRATLRGHQNLTKRKLGGALAHNLSLLMRHLTGHGTPKQWLARSGTALRAGTEALAACLALLAVELIRRVRARFAGRARPAPQSGIVPTIEIPRISTGC